ncbi:MAG: NTF2-like N-terminal transpeptidase domain-containing protein [Candidatus Humimicrobiaceae bacterium]
MRSSKKRFIVILMIPVLMLSSVLFLSGCREYDGRMDIAYFFKTEPEKAVIDFLECLNQKDTDYVYSNFLLSSEKSSVSREKYTEEFEVILKEIDGIKTTKTIYLGYEQEMSKVVAEFEITYLNGEIKQYKKYFYLIEEGGSWKIILEKTFI